MATKIIASEKSVAPTKAVAIVALSELVHGQEADLFALLAVKEELTTRDGKPYFKVTFRDHAREVCFPIWNDSTWALECRERWRPGLFYKLRAIYRDTNFGPQLDIKKIRETIPADSADGFDPLGCQKRTRFDPVAMFDDLTALVWDRVTDLALRGLVIDILAANREQVQTLPAATRNHHAHVGGWIEHVLSVTRTAAFLADKYDDIYSEMRPRLDKSLVVAGAALHDIGKLREYRQEPQGAVYSAEGALIGHILQGRDIVREAAAGRTLPPEILLRLEHIIVSHQRLPEWGSPKPPMTPEALLVHYADDLDAKFQMMFEALQDDATPGALTSKKNKLYQQVYRGGPDGDPPKT